MKITEKAVRGIIIFEDSKVILMFRRRDNREYYTIPGGHIEKFDKTEKDALRREIKEELGIEIQIIKKLFNNLLERFEEKGTYKEDIYYLCKYKSGKVGSGKAPEFNDPQKGFYRVDILKTNEIKGLKLGPEKVKNFILNYKKEKI